MATGIQSTNSSRVKTVRLVEAATAANAAPAGAPSSTPAATVGFLLGSATLLQGSCSVRIYSTAGSATMAMTYARLWGYSISSGFWSPLGTGADATKGYLNNGAAFGETGSDVIRHQEPIGYVDHLDGIYVELGVISGTSTAISVELDFSVNNAS